MRLRERELDIGTGSAAVLFDVPPQGNPGISRANYAALHQFCERVRARLQGKGEAELICSPHRIGVHNCISLLLRREGRQLSLLISVDGALSWPLPEEYQAQRWRISVPDVVDAIYLVVELERRLGC